MTGGAASSLKNDQQVTFKSQRSSLNGSLVKCVQSLYVSDAILTEFETYKYDPGFIYYKSRRMRVKIFIFFHISDKTYVHCQRTTSPVLCFVLHHCVTSCFRVDY